MTARSAGRFVSAAITVLGSIFVLASGHDLAWLPVIALAGAAVHFMSGPYLRTDRGIIPSRRERAIWFALLFVLKLVIVGLIFGLHLLIAR